MLRRDDLNVFDFSKIAEVFEEYGYTLERQHNIRKAIKRVISIQRLVGHEIEEFREKVYDSFNRGINQKMDTLQFLKHLCDLYRFDTRHLNNSITAYTKFIKSKNIYIYDFVEGKYVTYSQKELSALIRKNPYPLGSAKNQRLQCLLKTAF